MFHNRVATIIVAISAALQPVTAAEPWTTLQLAGPLTVSGLSSGGYMATQFHMAYSDLVNGAAVIAGGPWGCAQNSLATALSHCLNQANTPDLAGLQQQLTAAAATGQVADLKNLQKDKVFVLHGTKDTTVHRQVTDSLVSQYRQLGAEVLYVDDQPFAHHFPTLSTGTACDSSVSPFLGNCQYDAARVMLMQLLGELTPKQTTATGQLHSIKQQQLGGHFAAELGPDAYLFVPQACQQGQQCRLHISFHGCKQNAQTVGDAYARGTGLNEWAASNHLVVLYPQTKASTMAPMNPHGCWDWWGYTDSNYANRQGVQLQAVLQMVKALGYPLPAEQ